MSTIEYSCGHQVSAHSGQAMPMQCACGVGEIVGAREQFYMSDEMSKKFREAAMNASPLQAIKKEWNGEGLPPAGIECEVFDHEEKQYSRCKTLSAATMSGERACATIEPKGHFGRLIWGANFRPIRTKEQQERESAITKARNACPYPGSESTKIDVEALYDAGMLRKGAE